MCFPTRFPAAVACPFSPLLVREDQQARVVNFDSGFFPTNSTMATIPNGVKRRCDERRSQNEQKN